MVSVPRPGPDESAPSYQVYIGAVKGDNIGEQLLSQIKEVEDLIAPLDDSSSLARYAPGKWSIKEILGHLCDVERVFTYRLLRIAREDATPLPGFDENAYVPAAHFDDRSLASLLAELRAVRLSTIELVKGLPQDGWARWGEASGKRITARALIYSTVGHVNHHMRVLRERYGVGAQQGSTAATRG